MRKLRQLSMAVVLTLGLTASSLAGDIWIPAPPPPDSSSVTTPGEIQIPGDIGIGRPQSDPVTEVALNLLQAVLSIF